MRAYRFKIRRPSKRIVAEFEQVRELCRELYNAALQERRDAYRLCGKSINYFSQSAQLKDIRGERPDLGRFYAMVFEECLRRCARTYDAFFQRCLKGQTPGFPRFKSRARYSSFTYRQSGFKLTGDKLVLSKLGSVRLRLSRPVEGKIRNVTIKRQADGWFAILLVDESYSRWIPKTGESVGIDVGLESFATLSTGEQIENPQFLRASSRRLRIAQRKLSKRKRGGSNRSKVRQVVARIHQKIANQRRDFFHKLSLDLVRQFDFFAVEDLNIAGMVQNRHLAKSISDAAWGLFLTIHHSKVESTGRGMERVNPYRTSQDCCECGARMKLSLAQRVFRCLNCGSVKHRDLNASINILARAEPLVRAGVSWPSDPSISMC